MVMRSINNVMFSAVISIVMVSLSPSVISHSEEETSSTNQIIILMAAIQKLKNTDRDNDGVFDFYDAFLNDPAESVDTDKDGIGNNADSDDDNDGVADTSDLYPLDPDFFQDFNQDGIPDPLIGTLVGSTCNGTSAIDSIADGKGGLTTTTKQNVEACGYVQSLFQSKSLRMVDISPYLSDSCDGTVFNYPSDYRLFPVELNGDNQLDLIQTLWCGPTDAFNAVGITPNVLVAQLSDGEGNWTVENQLVFGEEKPSLLGAERKSVYGDFNNDGIVDIAFALNLEDGRANTDPMAWAAQPQILLSHTRNGEIGYDITTYANLAMTHAISARANSFGYDDIVMSGYQGDVFQAYRYVDGEWLDLSDQYPTESDGWGINIVTWGTDVVVADTCTDIGCGPGIYREEKGHWSITDVAIEPVIFNIHSNSYPSTEYYTVPVVNLNGRTVAHAATDQTCLMTNTPSGNPILVAEFWGSIPADGSEFEENAKYNDRDLIPVRSLKMYEIVQDQFVDRSGNIVNQLTDYRANILQCKDVNGDGYDDVYIPMFGEIPNDWRTSGQSDPLIYLSSGKNYIRYIPESDSEFPDSEAAMNEPTLSHMADVNSDGIQDLIIIPITVSKNSQYGYAEVFLGNRHLTIKQ